MFTNIYPLKQQAGEWRTKRSLGSLVEEARVGASMTHWIATANRLRKIRRSPAPVSILHRCTCRNENGRCNAVLITLTHTREPLSRTSWELVLRSTDPDSRKSREERKLCVSCSAHRRNIRRLARSLLFPFPRGARSRSSTMASAFFGRIEIKYRVGYQAFHSRFLAAKWLRNGTHELSVLSHRIDGCQS
jgi:hypothetical protein